MRFSTLWTKCYWASNADKSEEMMHLFYNTCWDLSQKTGDKNGAVDVDLSNAIPVCLCCGKCWAPWALQTGVLLLDPPSVPFASVLPT